MSKRLLVGVSGLLVLVAPGALRAQGVTIDHSAVGCVVAEQYPKLSACFTPAANVARARVYFRAAGGTSWYFVEMKSEASCYDGVLPKPKKTIKQINYYVEAVGKDFTEARTAEYDPDVVPDKGACKKELPAAPFLSKASVVVGAATGAPVVPAGFAAAGIAGAAGASTAVVAAGFAGAATAGIASTTTGGGTGPSSTTGSTTTTPSGGTQPPTTTLPPTPTTTTTLPALNRPPVAVFSVTPDPPQGTAPLTVQFSMCGSRDPDGDALSFRYDFGDGSNANAGCRAQHTYGKALAGSARALFNYTATDCVTDGHPDHEVCHGYEVSADCPFPEVSFTSPSAGSTVDSCDFDPNTQQPLRTVVSADATDVFGINFVEFSASAYRGSTPLGAVDTPPYEVLWDDSKSFGQVTLTARAKNRCGNVATATEKVNVSCISGFRPKATFGPRVSWGSRLDVPGGRGQVVLNGAAVSFPGAGRSMAMGEARSGENRIEAQLVEAAGQAGTWRFEFSGNESLAAGSLRVVTGEVAEVTADAIAFRLNGKPGERVSFTFKLRD